QRQGSQWPPLLVRGVRLQRGLQGLGFPWRGIVVDGPVRGRDSRAGCRIRTCRGLQRRWDAVKIIGDLTHSRRWVRAVVVGVVALMLAAGVVMAESPVPSRPGLHGEPNAPREHG